MQAAQNLSQVVQFEQSHTETITQTELALLVSLRKRLRQLEEQVAAAEYVIQHRLEQGARVEPGLLQAMLKIIERRSVAWKQVCERELGEAYCKRVLSATRPEKYVYFQIEVLR
jgi:hypothetical protein